MNRKPRKGWVNVLGIITAPLTLAAGACILFLAGLTGKKMNGPQSKPDWYGAMFTLLWIAFALMAIAALAWFCWWVFGN